MAKGVDIREIYDNHFPENHYFEDEDAEIKLMDEDGKWLLDDAKNYKTSDLGYMVPEGGRSYDTVAFSYFFNKWMKARTTAFLVVEVPKDAVELYKTKLIQMGLKVK